MAGQHRRSRAEGLAEIMKTLDGYKTFVIAGMIVIVCLLLAVLFVVTKQAQYVGDVLIPAVSSGLGAGALDKGKKTLDHRTEARFGTPTTPTTEDDW